MRRSAAKLDLEHHARLEAGREEAATQLASQLSSIKEAVQGAAVSLQQQQAGAAELQALKHALFSTEDAIAAFKEREQQEVEGSAREARCVA